MADLEKATGPQGEALSFTQEAVKIGIKVAEPAWRIVRWLIVALIITNLIWGCLYFYEIKKAYENPVEMEQMQDFPNEVQEQHYKG